MITIPLENYQSIRSQIKSGDTLVASGKGFFSWLIKKNVKKPILINKKNVRVTHVGTFVKIFNQLYVIEAVGKVRMVRFSEAYKKYNGSLYVLRPSINKETELYRYIDYQVALEGNKYAWKELIRVAKKKTRKMNNKWYCSEMLWMARNNHSTKHMSPHELVKMDPHFLFQLKNVGK